MIIGIPKEIEPGETNVALVTAGAGQAATCTDQQFIHSQLVNLFRFLYPAG